MAANASAGLTTAAHLPPGTAVTRPEDFHTYRHFYLRVSTQAANRFQASTFLAGLTVATFAALIAVSRDDVVKFTVWQLVASVALGCASVFFVLSAVSTYAALQRLGDVAPATQDLFKSAAPQSFLYAEGERLRYAFNSYVEGSPYLPAGLLLLLLSLVLIGFHLSTAAGVIVLVLLIVLAALLPTSWNITFDYKQRQSRSDALPKVTTP